MERTKGVVETAGLMVLELGSVKSEKRTRVRAIHRYHEIRQQMVQGHGGGTSGALSSTKRIDFTRRQILAAMSSMSMASPLKGGFSFGVGRGDKVLVLVKEVGPVGQDPIHPCQEIRKKGFLHH